MTEIHNFADAQSVIHKYRKPTAAISLAESEESEETEEMAGGEPVVPVELQSTLLSGLVSAAWLDRQDFPPLEEIVPGILTEGFGFIVGPPKAGKSWLVGNLAIACASGGRALGQIKVTARPVLYLALEDGHRRLQSRFRILTHGQALPGGLDILTKVQPGKMVGTITEWLDLHQGEKPLVILDTFGKGRPQPQRGENPYLADYSAGSALKDLIDLHPGAGLLAVHHSRKAESDDFLDAVSGTQGLAGSADYVLVLTRKRKSDEGALAITGRDVTETEIAMTTSGGRWTLAGSTTTEAARALDERREQGSLGDRSSEVLAIVKDWPEPVSPAVIADELKIDNKAAGQYLARLVDSGRIRRIARGKYTTEESEETEEMDSSLSSLSSVTSPVIGVWKGSGQPITPTRRQDHT